MTIAAKRFTTSKDTEFLLSVANALSASNNNVINASQTFYDTLNQADSILNKLILAGSDISDWFNATVADGIDSAAGEVKSYLSKLGLEIKDGIIAEIPKIVIPVQSLKLSPQFTAAELAAQAAAIQSTISGTVIGSANVTTAVSGVLNNVTQDLGAFFASLPGAAATAAGAATGLDFSSYTGLIQDVVAGAATAATNTPAQNVAMIASVISAGGNFSSHGVVQAFIDNISTTGTGYSRADIVNAAMVAVRGAIRDNNINTVIEIGSSSIGRDLLALNPDLASDLYNAVPQMNSITDPTAITAYYDNWKSAIGLLDPGSTDIVQKAGTYYDQAIKTSTAGSTAGNPFAALFAPTGTLATNPDGSAKFDIGSIATSATTTAAGAAVAAGVTSATVIVDAVFGGGF